jgi:hypothetical protein
MDPVSLTSLGLGVGSSILGMKFGFDQAAQQRKETAEQVRRFQLVKTRTESEATALGNASGITSDSGSLTKYLADMSKEFGKQMDWLRQSGEDRASATEMSSMLGGAANFGSSLFSYGSANNWFRTPAVT